jgi:hypothetical protein
MQNNTRTDKPRIRMMSTARRKRTKQEHTDAGPYQRRLRPGGGHFGRGREGEGEVKKKLKRKQARKRTTRVGGRGA